MNSTSSPGGIGHYERFAKRQRRLQSALLFEDRRLFPAKVLPHPWLLLFYSSAVDTAEATERIELEATIGDKPTRNMKKFMMKMRHGVSIPAVS